MKTDMSNKEYRHKGRQYCKRIVNNYGHYLYSPVNYTAISGEYATVVFCQQRKASSSQKIQDCLEPEVWENLRHNCDANEAVNQKPWYKRLSTYVSVGLGIILVGAYIYDNKSA